MSKIVVILLCTLILSHCMSAAFTGADIVYHRTRYTDSVKNHFISIEGQRRLNAAPQLAGTNVSVSGFDTTALLVGEVSTLQQKHFAENTIRPLPGVKSIINSITIGPKIPHSQMLADTWITTKIKTRMIFNASFDPDEVKIVTENATVYLMGALPTKQAKEAIEIARHTDGVKKVITAMTFLVPSYTQHHA